ncbi:unnamed protein product [Orchesella dallaii]|uniref:O-acyltransferase WSD1 C-terminal domain-containing protein n=1 Tax=Orchesella dallaii TaxID=48710 RepID=A0ABP1Q107_9HEXA
MSSIMKTILFVLNGIFSFPLYLIFIILCLPIYIYRLLIILWVKYFYNDEFGDILSAISAMFAVELLPSKKVYPPRTAICVQMVLDGKLTVEEMEDIINKNWLRNNSYSRLKQYVEPFMGFMFWKRDTEFNLKNHLKSHTLENNDENQMDVDQKVCQFLEKLLNKQFKPKTSPWEFYIINNYKNEQLKNQCAKEEMTLLIFRIHHSLADGFSILYTVIEDLFETPLPKIAPATPKLSATQKIMFAFSTLFRIPQDYAKFVGLPLYPRTPLYTPDERRECELLYERNVSIPLQRVKDIKNKLGVSFTGVLLTTVSAAIAKTLFQLQKKKGGNIESFDKTPFGFPLPAPRTSKKLENSATAAILELPTKLELNSMERLQEVERLLVRAKTTTFPLIVPVIVKTVGYLFPFMTKYLTKNRFIPAGFSSFPGPQIDIYVRGKKILMMDGLGGIHNGTMGVGFLILSFGSVIRIGAMAVDGTINRKELKELLRYIREELDSLEKFAKANCHISAEKKVL